MDYCLKVLAWNVWLYFGQLPQLEKTLFNYCRDLTVELKIWVNFHSKLVMVGLMYWTKAPKLTSEVPLVPPKTIPSVLLSLILKKWRDIYAFISSRQSSCGLTVAHTSGYHPHNNEMTNHASWLLNHGGANKERKGEGLKLSPVVPHKREKPKRTLFGFKSDIKHIKYDYKDFYFK